METRGKWVLAPDDPLLGFIQRAPLLMTAILDELRARREAAKAAASTSSMPATRLRLVASRGFVLEDPSAA